MAPGDVDGAEHGIDRRRALIGLGVGATAAWVAPTIISQSAAAAATVEPLCSMCFEEAIVNGGAESGVLSPWIPFGSNEFAVDTWTNITAAGITPLAGSGTYAFTGFTTSGSTADGRLDQDVVIDPACQGLPFDLAADLGGVAPTAFVDVSLAVEFYDDVNTPLGNGGASGLLRQIVGAATDGMLRQTTGGTVPIGATVAVISAFWGGEGESPYVARAAVDNVSFIVSCLQ